MGSLLPWPSSFPGGFWGGALAALSVIHTLLMLLAVYHALLNKRHSRSALGWIGFILIFPIVGPLGYGLFGINRVETRSRQLRDSAGGKTDFHEVAGGTGLREDIKSLELDGAVERILRVGGAVSNSPLRRQNAVRLLVNGEEAYPSMLRAIRAAEARVWMTTYIFETNSKGREFIDALAEASERGVDVRVIIDGMGEWYSRPRAGTLLQRAGVSVVRFLRPRLVPPQIYGNLRNHRKVLCVDSAVGYAGGMNVGGRHMVDPPETDAPTQDLHFGFAGPILEDLEKLFLHDWGFVTKSREDWKPADAGDAALEASGVEADAPRTSLCRVVPDGPDHELNKLEALFNAVISSASERLVVVTPYFLPSEPMVSSLIAARLRGVEVVVILPERSNLMYVQSATWRILPWLTKYGVRIMRQPPPFSHAKLLVVDDTYICCGSANIDPRSLRLNFEVGIEVVGAETVEAVNTWLAETLARSREITEEEIRNRPVWKRLGDGFCWLFSPYL